MQWVVARGSARHCRQQWFLWCSKWVVARGSARHCRQQHGYTSAREKWFLWCSEANCMKRVQRCYQTDVGRGLSSKPHIMKHFLVVGCSCRRKLVLSFDAEYIDAASSEHIEHFQVEKCTLRLVVPYMLYLAWYNSETIKMSCAHSALFKASVFMITWSSCMLYSILNRNFWQAPGSGEINSNTAGDVLNEIYL
jgi:hypothetical protein